MTKQKRRQKKKNTIILGYFSLKSLHMKRMREITIHANSLFFFITYPLIQIMDIFSHPSSSTLQSFEANRV